MTRLDKVSRAAVDALEDVKARDIVVFDVKKMTAYFDKVIVATGDSNRHCRALAGRVQEQVKAAGGKIYGIEGEKTGEWLLVDIGAAVVHIMQPAIRQYYNLEELWASSPQTAKSAKTVKVKKIAKAAKPAKVTKVTKAAKVAKSAKAPAPRKAAKARATAAPPRKNRITQ
jgi:ribosome-associated protein